MTQTADEVAGDGASHQPPPFRYRRGPDGQVIVTGDIDLASARAFQPVMLASTDPVELDLTEVTFMDSAGIKVLLLARQVRPVHITGASPAVSRVLELLGLTEIFAPEQHATPFER